MKTLLTLLWTALLCRGLTFGQGILRIGFDGPPTQPPGTAFVVHSYIESGILFTSIPEEVGFTRNGGGISSSPANGSAYIQQTSVPWAPVTFSFIDGSVFDFVSVQLAEYSTVLSNPTTVEFVGYHPDGSTVTQSFTTDGIIDGTGPLRDFQIFSFTGFTGLTRVEIPSSAWSMDNLVISVPEPAVSGFQVIGGMILLFHARQLKTKGNLVWWKKQKNREIYT